MTRVKVVNDGRIRATKVAVILRSITPPLRGTSVVGDSFAKMKDPQVTTFEVSPRVPVYVDVLWQSAHAAEGCERFLALVGKRVKIPEPVNDFALALQATAEVEVEPLELVFKRSDPPRRLAQVIEARVVKQP